MKRKPQGTPERQLYSPVLGAQVSMSVALHMCACMPSSDGIHTCSCSSTLQMAASDHTSHAELEMQKEAMQQLNLY